MHQVKQSTSKINRSWRADNYYQYEWARAEENWRNVMIHAMKTGIHLCVSLCNLMSAFSHWSDTVIKILIWIFTTNRKYCYQTAQKGQSDQSICCSHVSLRYSWNPALLCPYIAKRRIGYHSCSVVESLHKRVSSSNTRITIILSLDVYLR